MQQRRHRWRATEDEDSEKHLITYPRCVAKRKPSSSSPFLPLLPLLPLLGQEDTVSQDGVAACGYTGSRQEGQHRSRNCISGLNVEKERAIEHSRTTFFRGCTPRPFMKKGKRAFGFGSDVCSKPCRRRGRREKKTRRKGCKVKTEEKKEEEEVPPPVASQ